MKRAALAMAIVLALASCVTKGPGGSSPAPSGDAPLDSGGALPSGSPVPGRIPVLQKEATFSAGGQMTQYTTQDWTPDLLNLLSRKTYDADDPRPVISTTFTYEKGLLTQEVTLDSKGASGGKSLYSYNAAGQMTEEKRYDQTNALAFVSKFEYNAAGQKTSWKVYSIRNKLIGQTDYEYTNGRLTRMRMIDGDGRPGLSIKYSYDSKDQLVSREYYDGNGKLEKKESLGLGFGGLLVEKTISEGKDLLFSTSYEYEKETGALIRKVMKNPIGAVTSWTIYYYSYREGVK